MMSLSLLLTAVISQVDTNNLPRYNSCIDWAQAVTSEGDRIVLATDENEFYFCVFVTNSRRVGFCAHDTRPQSERDNEWAFTMTDLKGKEVRLAGEKAQELVFKEHNIKAGVAAVTEREFMGTIYTLKEDAPRHIKIMFRSRNLTNEKSNSAFEHIIDTHLHQSN